MIRLRSLKPFLFLIFFFACLYPDKNKRYGVLKINIQPRGAQIKILDLNQSQKTMRGKKVNILPLGDYAVSITKSGYVSQQYNVEITLTGKKLMVNLKKTPRTLFVHSPDPVYEVYIDGQKKFDVTDNTMKLRGLPADSYEFFLLNPKNHYAYKEIDLIKNNHDQWRIKKFRKPKHVLAWSTITGALLPGVNYFIHAPDHWAGFVYPTAVLFYGFFAATMITASQNVITDAESRPEVFVSAMAIGTGITALLHAIFSFLGTYKDLETMYLYKRLHPDIKELSRIMKRKSPFMLKF